MKNTKHSKMLFMFLTLITLGIGCKNTENLPINLKFPLKETTSKTVFNIIDSIEVKSKDKDSITILGIHKIMDFQKGFLILDRYSTRLFYSNSSGLIENIVAKKGRGPGEYLSIVDYDIDEKDNIYILDFKQQIVGKFGGNLKFIQNYKLSFNHRLPLKMVYVNNGRFVINAYNNLEDGASKTNFTFLSYEDCTFLNLYDSNFVKIKSFLSPPKELYTTRGVLAKAIGHYINIKKISSEPNLFISLGNSYKGIEKFKKAEECYRIASNIIPHKYYPKYLLAKLYEKTNRNKETKVVAQQIINMKVKVSSTATYQIICEMKEILNL